jgi:hypothetical protein
MEKFNATDQFHLGPPDIPGFIYVVSSPDMPGLLKVGFTERTVAERLKQLSAHSTVPRPLICVWSCATSAARFHEQETHKLLKPHHHGKEWFRVDLSVVIEAAESVQREFDRPLEDIV